MPEQPETSPKAEAMSKDLANLPGRIDTYFSSYIDSNKSIPPTDRALTKYEAILSVINLGSELIRQSFTPEQKQELSSSLKTLKEQALTLTPEPESAQKLTTMLDNLQKKLDIPANNPFTAPEDIKALQTKGVLSEITKRIEIVKKEITTANSNPLSNLQPESAQELTTITNRLQKALSKYRPQRRQQNHKTTPNLKRSDRSGGPIL
jgi:hypothetical protein